MGPISGSNIGAPEEGRWGMGINELSSALDHRASPCTSSTHLNYKEFIVVIDEVLLHYLFSYFIGDYLKIGKWPFLNP